MTRNDIEPEISDLDVDVSDEDVEREHTDWEGVMINCMVIINFVPC